MRRFSSRLPGLEHCYALLISLFLIGTAHSHVHLIAPNGGESVKTGATVTIEWELQIQHNQLDWDLWYSVSGSGGPWILIAENLAVGDPGSGSIHTYEWTVPQTATAQARVRVRQDNTTMDYLDHSDADFSITAPELTTSVVATGLNNPVFLSAPPNDTSRLFVLEQGGLIRVIKEGVLLSRPFLDIQDRVLAGGERGLLGLAFHPDYSGNGFFFVNYTASSPTGQTTVSRFAVSPSDPDSAVAAGETIILELSQPYPNHNGGMIAFGPTDGKLYIGMGDGGSAGDPENNSQNGNSLLGKMLRIDVDAGSPYAIPGDNPFLSNGSVLSEIWALGLRNPWRWSFDRESADLYIADVGQGLWEEINYQAAAGGGENYGWRLKEGDHCYDPATLCDPVDTLDDPIYEYDHVVGPRGFRCSITGGYVYRGCAMPELAGTYFFADHCSGEVWSFVNSDTGIIDLQDRTDDLFGESTFGISSFGEDARGELYVLDYSINGRVLKIVPTGAAAQCELEACCTGTTMGNADCIGIIDIGDITAMIQNLFITLGPFCCEAEADLDQSEVIDIGDLSLLISSLFITLNPLAACP